jgi:hypothetical protein
MITVVLIVFYFIMFFFLFYNVLGAVPSAFATMELGAPTAPSKVSPKAEKTPSHLPESYADRLLRIPQMAAFGPLFKSSQPQPLTESETEYIVECIKHIFPEHIVFQVSHCIKGGDFCMYILSMDL